MTYYKILTHDLRPPIQGGDPLWEEGVSFPILLPAVLLDESEEECGAGWNACRSPSDALRIAGLWRSGLPARLFEVESESPWINRKDKSRTAGPLRILREIPISDEILADLHRPLAGEGLPIEDIVAEVQAWRAALARPRHDREAVIRGLKEALKARGLADWSLQEFPSAQDARVAWDAMGAMGAMAAIDASAARDIWEAWDARDAWDTWEARDAKDARDALMVFVAARRGWTKQDSLLLTRGIREAYAAGLKVAIPVGEKILGWSVK